MKELRIRNMSDKMYRVAKKMAVDADLSLPAFALEALDEKIARVSDAAEAERKREPKP